MILRKNILLDYFVVVVVVEDDEVVKDLKKM